MTTPRRVEPPSSHTYFYDAEDDDDKRVVLSELNPKQKEVARIMREALPGSRTLIGYGGGMSGGKTELLARMIGNLSLGYPGSRILVGRETLTSLKTTTMERFFKIWPMGTVISKFNAQENWAEIRNPAWPDGLVSKVFFRGLEDYEKKGSEEFSALIFDEAHEISDAAFRYYLTRLRHPLPRKVAARLARQCRICLGVAPPEVNPKGMKCAKCNVTLGNGLRYFVLAAANPWPGWFTDVFWKREFSGLEALGDASVHFVQALPKDNPHNDGDGKAGSYEAFLRATLTPEEVKRFVEGQFDVFAGRVYEHFDPEVHRWRNPNIPEYDRVIGGLDFGGESSTTSHYSTGIVGVITRSKKLIRVAEFKYRGPDVAEKQMQWMLEQQQKWADPIKKKIAWRADRSQMVGIQLWRKIGFLVSYSKGGRDSVEEGVKAVARRLTVDPVSETPGSYYLPSLVEFETEMKEYRRKEVTTDRGTEFIIVKENDDMVAADRYMEELMTINTGDPNQLFRNNLPRVI